MQLQVHDIDIILNDNKFIEYHSLGLIDDISVRNLVIKAEYVQLREIYSMLESIFLLSEKHFLSTDSINSILFRRRKRKNIPSLPSP